ncbi:MAG: PilZ domain-containing protein [Oscillospiraceae bacterium]|nr:PilZ domain-containing protein [Oscillospiraceae bacterium]
MAEFRNPSYVGHYAKEQSVIPNVYNGMRMEVLDRGNELLFVGDVEVQDPHMIEIVRTSDLLSPTVVDGMSVSIRGFNAYENCGVHMDGVLSKLAHDQDRAWLIKELDVKGKDAGRSFSRRPIEAKAWVRPAGDGAAKWLECRVVNASAGGVCFRMTEPLEIAAKLSIRFYLGRDHEQPPLNIVVRRASDRGSEYEYGCEFVDLSPEVDTVITRTIIRLQIMQ